MLCPTCGGKQSPLFSSWYCPKCEGVNSPTEAAGYATAPEALDFLLKSVEFDGWELGVTFKQSGFQQVNIDKYAPNNSPAVSLGAYPIAAYSFGLRDKVRWAYVYELIDIIRGIK